MIIKLIHCSRSKITWLFSDEEIVIVLFSVAWPLISKAQKNVASRVVKSVQLNTTAGFLRRLRGKSRQQFAACPFLFLLSCKLKSFQLSDYNDKFLKKVELYQTDMRKDVETLDFGALLFICLEGELTIKQMWTYCTEYTNQENKSNHTENQTLTSKNVFSTQLCNKNIFPVIAELGRSK